MPLWGRDALFPKPAACGNWKRGCRKQGNQEGFPVSLVFPVSLPSRFLSYCDSSAFAGLNRAARRAGITVAATVIAVIRMVELARISGSAALIA